MTTYTQAYQVIRGGRVEIEHSRDRAIEAVDQELSVTAVTIIEHPGGRRELVPGLAARVRHERESAR